MIVVRYFASLRECAGRESETIEPVADLRDLYRTLAQKHAFPMTASQLRVAVNGEFAEWSRPLADGDEVVFIPPVSGG